jgi:hypothetical protein
MGVEKCQLDNKIVWGKWGYIKPVLWIAYSSQKPFTIASPAKKI